MRPADVARLAVAAGSCDALAHQHSAALQHDSRTDRGVFSLPPTFPSTSSLFIRHFLFLRYLTALSFPSPPPSEPFSLLVRLICRVRDLVHREASAKCVLV